MEAQYIRARTNARRTLLPLSSSNRLRSRSCSFAEHRMEEQHSARARRKVFLGSAFKSQCASSTSRGVNVAGRRESTPRVILPRRLRADGVAGDAAGDAAGEDPADANPGEEGAPPRSVTLSTGTTRTESSALPLRSRRSSGNKRIECKQKNEQTKEFPQNK